jgi:hypothetical protein
MTFPLWRLSFRSQRALYSADYFACPLWPTYPYGPTLKISALECRHSLEIRRTRETPSMSINLLPKPIRQMWEVHEYRHACAILATDFPQEWKDLLFVLNRFRLFRSSILTPGGRKSPIAVSINGLFSEKGWVEKHFDVTITIDGQDRHTPTHGIDYFKNGVAIETEWNNKDPFYDRDLNNFRLLFDLRAVSVGVVLTRSDALQAIFDQLGRGKSFGASTTHMSRLMPKIESGSVGGCPLLVFGITKNMYVEDEIPPSRADAGSSDE